MPAAPIEVRLAALREKRLAMGVSLDELARRTRIPVAHLEALEASRFDELPAGPYIEGYYRTVASALGQSVESKKRDAAPSLDLPPPFLPLWVVRTVAIGAALTLVALFSLQLWRGDVRPLDRGPALADSESLPDQHLVVEGRRGGPMQVWVDDEQVFDGRIEPGQRRTFDARHRIELRVSGAEIVRLTYNDAPVVPQGRQNTPRRIVFVDDLGSGD